MELTSKVSSSSTHSTYYKPDCRGGMVIDAYYYVRSQSNGVTYDSMYPYNISARTCDVTKYNYAVTVTDLTRVRGEQAMVNHVLGGGTLTASIDASTWGSYKRGVFTNCRSQLTINHAVQIVGVNVTGRYWILRNSWGSRWGDNGYMKLALVRTLVCNTDYLIQFGAMSCFDVHHQRMRDMICSD